MITLACDRCYAEFTAKDEYLVELMFDQHECKGMPSLESLPLDILRKLAYGEITEEQAFEMTRERV